MGNDRTIFSLLVFVPLIGAALSMVAAGAAGLFMTPGIGRVAVSWVVGASGLALTAFAFWRTSGAFAADPRRAGVVALLAFLAVHDQAWIGLLQLESRHAKISADFALTCVAFVVAMRVYYFLQPSGALPVLNALEDSAL